MSTVWIVALCVVGYLLGGVIAVAILLDKDDGQNMVTVVLWPVAFAFASIVGPPWLLFKGAMFLGKRLGLWVREHRQ